MAQRVPLHDPESAIKSLSTDGGVILTSFCDPVDIDQVNKDAAPFIQAILSQRSPNHPPETVRNTRLFGRSEIARESLLQQPDLHRILNHFLRTTSKPSHYPHEAEPFITDPILSASATLQIMPGVQAQPLHRDDWLWQVRHEERREEDLDTEVCIGVLIPGAETTKENGATLFVPGSHLWAHDRSMGPEEAAAAAMAVGEAFVFLGSTFHGGGTNTTAKARPVHSFFYCRSYIRPEENQHLWWKYDEVKKWSTAAQRQAGYILGNPNIGHCNETHPIDLFRASGGSMQE